MRSPVRRAGLGIAVSAAIGAAFLVAVAGSDRASRAPGHGKLVLRSAGHVLAKLAVPRGPGGGASQRARLAAAVTHALPARLIVRKGRARIEYRNDRAAAVRTADRLGPDGGTVEVSRHPVASLIGAPAIRQVERNDCETTALSILLETVGVHTGQHELQARIARSGPLDPQRQGASEIWGDPELGFVGRPDGGGVAGGFGVYERPVAKLAGRYGRALGDLTGSPAGSIYSRLLEGHAVMAWVGLSHGPYGHWRSPTGRSITVNFGEHTVVLAGVHRDGTLAVVNPLHGTDETWSRQNFESMWSMLGRRALTT
jgi:uncharacterized protein YvpB